MKLEIILDELIQKHSLNFIVENLNVSKNTIQRWMSINKVPNEYKFELYRLNGMDVDYTLFSFKEKDQFFTPKNVSEKCFGKENMRTYTKFEDLPNQRGYGIVFIKDKENNIKRIHNVDWVKSSFLSTNSAFNLRSSQIFNNLEKYIYNKT